MPNHWVIIFESVHYVMKAEKVLKEQGLKILLIPTPRKISSDCGVALEILGERIDIIKEILKKNKLVPEGYYKKEKMEES